MDMRVVEIYVFLIVWATIRLSRLCAGEEDFVLAHHKTNGKISNDTKTIPTTRYLPSLYYAPAVEIRSRPPAKLLNVLSMKEFVGSLFYDDKNQVKNHFSNRSKRFSKRFSLQGSPSSLAKDLGMTTNDQSYPDPSNAVYLGSIHKQTYERIINESFINLGSTASSGQVSATEPYIDPATPDRILAYKGNAAIMPCFVNNLGQRSVSWVRHKDIHVLTVGRFTFTNDDRFLSHHEDGSNEWALQLSSPEVEDTGYYECQVNTKPIITRLIFLKVLEPHAVISGPEELYIKLGSTIALHCKVFNTPTTADFLIWYHNNKVSNYEEGRVSINVSQDTNQTSSILRIESARERDSGKYTCSPSNAKDASVKVHVINGEHPAAMQTNVASVVRCDPNYLISAILTYVGVTFSNFGSYKMVKVKNKMIFDVS